MRGHSTFLIRTATCQAGRTGHRHEPAAIRSSSASDNPKNDFASPRDRPANPITRSTTPLHATSIALGRSTIVPRASPPAHEGDSSSEEDTSELQSLTRLSDAVYRLQNKSPTTSHLNLGNHTPQNKNYPHL